MHCRHNRHAEVDQPPLVPHPEASILRHAPLRNVQLRHDFNTRKNRLVVLARNRRHRLLQHAVDAVLHNQRVILRLKVNIRRAALQRSKDRGVHQADDRRDILARRQPLHRDTLVGVLFGRKHIEREALGRLIEHTLRLLRLLQQIRNLRQRRHPRHQPRTQQPRNLIQHHQLRGVRDRNRQPPPGLLQRHKVIAKHHIHRHTFEQLVLDLEVLQIHKLRVVPPRQRLRAIRLVKRRFIHRVRNCDRGGHKQ